MAKCRVCKSKYEKRDITQKACTIECSLEVVRLGRKKKKAQELKDLKKKVSDDDKKGWTKKAQKAFNAYIRVRDHSDGCISCSVKHGVQFHAGHYKTVGGHPALRFDEDNCHKQCAQCNNFRSGNITGYRINLIKRIGITTVDFLEGPHTPKKYTIEDLKEITKKYKLMTKKLAQAQDMV